MESIIGHRINYNGVRALRGQQHIPSKKWPKYPPGPFPFLSLVPFTLDSFCSSYPFGSPKKFGVNWLKSRNGTLINFRCNGPFHHQFCTKNCLHLFSISYVKMRLISKPDSCADRYILAPLSAYQEAKAKVIKYNLCHKNCTLKLINTEHLKEYFYWIIHYRPPHTSRFFVGRQKIFTCRLGCGEFRQVCDKVGACRAISGSATSQNILSGFVG